MTALGDYLAARRARVTPEAAGLPDFGRRRVPGLRREELAQLAGVSVDYVVRLEQGRATRPSADVLEALARALRLDEIERRHLHDLAAPAPTRRRPVRPERVRPHVQQLLDRLGDVPAIVLGRRMDVLAWNRLANALYDWASLPPHERNSARCVFLHEDARAMYVDWEDIARDTVGYLRRQADLYPDDEGIAALVGELSVKDAHFARWWAAADVRERTSGLKRHRHPVVGELDLHYETLLLPGEADQALIAYTAEPGSPSDTALRLLSAWVADRDPARA